MNMLHMNRRSTTHGLTTYSVHISQGSTTGSSEATSFSFFHPSHQYQLQYHLIYVPACRDNLICLVLLVVLAALVVLVVLVLL